MRTSFITDRSEIDEIIRKCDICFLGIAEKYNAPYVIPMNFGYDGGNEIFLHSAPEGKHTELLQNNNQVCITFCSDRKIKYQHPDVACSYSVESKSVLCKGTVSFVENDHLDEKREVMNIIMKNYSDKNFEYSEPALRNVKVWRVKINEITAKAFGQNFKNS